MIFQLIVDSSEDKYVTVFHGKRKIARGVHCAWAGNSGKQSAIGGCGCGIGDYGLGFWNVAPFPTTRGEETIPY